MKMKVVCSNILLAWLLAVGTNLAHAQTRPTLIMEAMRMDQMAATLGDSTVIGKIGGEFSSFLGAEAKAVVTGLRRGTAITLTTTTRGGTPGAPPTLTTTAINPPTGKMEFGNVFISLALARQQLGQFGIAQPTPEQLQAALLGGSVTTGSGATATTVNLQGILTMRSQNMGWGRISHQLGLKLAPVVSGLKSANHRLAAGASSTGGAGIVNTGGQAIGERESEIVTGSGDR